MKPDDPFIPSIRENMTGLTRQEWVNLNSNIATVSAKLDQLLEFRREDVRRMNRLEERQDKFDARLQAFDDRMSVAEKENSKVMGRREIILLISGSLLGGIVTLLSGFDLKTILSFAVAHIPHKP